MDIKALNSLNTQDLSNKVNESPKEVGDFDALLEEAKKTGDTSKLREATDALETVFINMMLKTMRTSIPETEGFFKKSESEKTFQGMLDEAYAEKMSKAGGIGISDMIFDQFEKSLYNEEDDKKVSSFELKG
jgi:flagellar protein FlgJ